MTFFHQLKQLFTPKREGAKRENRGKRRDPPFVGHSSIREIENAPPERAAELAGHAPERVDT